ncbi:MAG: hypothetical protein ABEJ35_03110 [Halobacteriaceae archaeon]
MLLVVAHSRAARRTLRSAAEAHPDTVVRRFGRAVIVADTAFGAFLACRLRTEFGEAIQVERTVPFIAEVDVAEDVRRAAVAYAGRDTATTPYASFAAGTEHPDPDALKGRPRDEEAIR